jgi:hypothetical protein
LPVDTQLIVICTLTFIIHVIGTLAYSVRIAGVRTRRIAVSFALFNILILLSRTSNALQGPFLAKRVEESLHATGVPTLLADFRWLLFSATLATLVGGFLVPTFQRLFSRAVLHFQIHRSIPRLLIHGFLKGGISQIKDAISIPSRANVTGLRIGRGLSTRVFALNVIAVAFWTVGVVASLYAGFLNPELRVTASTLSSVINGGATILMFVFIDPHMSIMTDDVMEGRVTEPSFRQAVVWLIASRFTGTLLAQLLLIPAASLIALMAEKI